MGGALCLCCVAAVFFGGPATGFGDLSSLFSAISLLRIGAMLGLVAAGIMVIAEALFYFPRKNKT